MTRGNVKSEIRKNFAENLRRECSKFPSIAHVCRALGINRQQFNRYLSGRYLPRPGTRRMMSELFGLPEEEMFQAPITPPNSSHNFDQAALLSFLIQSQMALPNASPSEIPEGFYFLYFSLKSDRRMVVRSVVKAKRLLGQTIIVWHTLFRAARFPSKILHRGRNVGAFFVIRNETWLVALSGNGPGSLSVVSFEGELGGRGLYSGMAIMRGVSGTYLCRVCIEYLGSQYSHVKAKLITAGVISLVDPSLPMAVRRIMEIPV